MAKFATESIYLDCGDGVSTDESAENATEFWIAMPPVTFSKGFTVEVTNTYGQVKTQKTNREITIARNAVKPMSTFQIRMSTSHEILDFAISDGTKEYHAFQIDTAIFIQVPNGINLSNMKVSFKHNGQKIYRNNEETASGEYVDLSDFSKPIRYKVESADGELNSYGLYLFDLPILFADTPNHYPITSKLTWIENCSFKLIENDGSTLDLGHSCQMKGRGSSSWNLPKKPYAIKLSSKKPLLGMAESKRWDLIANYRDKTLLRNDVTYMIARESEHLEWSPDGRFIELILNGKICGNYYLCEHIKIEQSRLNLVEMNPATDISGDNLTGAYLIEMTYYFDSGDKYKFYTDRLHLGATLKNPDEDVQTCQIDYIKGYLDSIETVLSNPEKLANREYLDLIDVDTYVDYWLVEELVGNFDSAKPKSTYCYKNRTGGGRDARMKAGPVWDFDVYTFAGNTNFVMKDSLYYRYLFKDPLFVAHVKESWNGNGTNLKGLRNTASVQKVCDYIDDKYTTLKNSASRDEAIWLIKGMNYDGYINNMKNAYKARYNWFNNAINSFVIDYDQKPGGNEDFDSQIGDGSGWTEK